MSAMPKLLLTEREYLAKERKAEYKSEFYKGEMFAMAGASRSHNRIKDNFARHLGNALEDGNCHVITSDLRVKIPSTGLYTYPDALVVCEEEVYDDDQEDTLLNPSIVIEILSKSTEKYDRGAKFEQYRSVDSLREYWLLSQDKPWIQRHVRQPDGTWIATVFDDPAGDAVFASVPARIPLAKIYRGVEFKKDSIT